MSRLQELQRRVAAAVMHPLTRDERMRHRRADGVSNEAEATALIRPNDRLTAFERLEIYNRQYWFRLYSSFEEDFPGLQAILGRTRFEKLMRTYLTECPSHSFTLRNLGSRLVQWLESNQNWIQPLPELALSMVRLEWAHIEAFDAADLPSLTSKDLAEVNEESRLELQPYLRLLTLSHPVDDLLIAIRHQDARQDSATNSASAARRRVNIRKTAALGAEQIYLAVHRQENSVYYKRLSRYEYQLLSSLLAGDSLETAIENSMATAGLPEQKLSQFLQESFATWSMLSWFVQPKRISS